MRLAKQETLTLPGHLVSSLVCRVRECLPWCSIVGAAVAVHQFFCILDKIKSFTDSHNVKGMAATFLVLDLMCGAHKIIGVYIRSWMPDNVSVT